MPETFRLYLFHQGARGNDFYTVHLRCPTLRAFPGGIDETTGQPTSVYGTEEPPLFHFCLRGMERHLKMRVPLGEIRLLTCTLDEVR